MVMNSAVGRARFLARTMDTNRRPGAEPLHEGLTDMRGEANAHGASAATLTAIDEALAEIEAIWDPATSGTYSRAHELTAEAIKAVSNEFDAGSDVYQWWSYD